MKTKPLIFALGVCLLLLSGCAASVGADYGYYPAAPAYYGPVYVPRPYYARPYYARPYYGRPRPAVIVPARPYYGRPSRAQFDGGQPGRGNGGQWGGNSYNGSLRGRGR